eukprot:748028-Hanusia_phi.AAC.2
MVERMKGDDSWFSSVSTRTGLSSHSYTARYSTVRAECLSHGSPHRWHSVPGSRDSQTSRVGGGGCIYVTGWVEKFNGYHGVVKSPRRVGFCPITSELPGTSHFILLKAPLCESISLSTTMESGQTQSYSLDANIPGALTEAYLVQPPAGRHECLGCQP